MQEEILIFFQNIANPFLDMVFKGITMLGEEYFLIAVITYFYYNISKKYGFFIAFLHTSSSFLNAVLKIAFHTDRPFLVSSEIEGKRVHTAAGYSFPSGHTQGSATFFTSLAMIIKKWWVFIISFIIIFLVGISRLYLGVHWPVDVFFGMMIGILWAVGGFLLLERLYNNFRLFMIFIFSFSTIVFLITIIVSGINYFIYKGEIITGGIDKIGGVLVGICIGFFLEEKFFPFSVKNVFWKKLIRYIGSLLIVGVFYIGMSLLFPKIPVLNFLRYLIIGVLITAGIPALGIKLRVFTKEH